MKDVIRILLISILTAGAVGCSADTTTKDADIASRTLLKVTLIDGLNSDTSSVGDTFMARLAESIVISGATVLEKGTILSGLVSESAESGVLKEDATIGFTLTGITQGDHTIPIVTNTFSATSIAGGKQGSEIVSGRAGIGDEPGRTELVSLRNGGVGFAFAATGREIHYGPETRLNFTLKEPVRFQILADTSLIKSSAVSN
jgi:hypothetical protein